MKSGDGGKEGKAHREDSMKMKEEEWFVRYITIKGP